MTSICVLSYIKLFFNLFILVNPIGLIPIFISITENLSKKKINHINLISNITASLILCISLFFGNLVLNIFSISIQSFKIAGGLLILHFSIKMLNKKEFKKKSKNFKKIDNLHNENIGVVPLAIPLIAGPGAISTTILWSTNCHNLLDLFFSVFIIFFFSFFCWILFKLSPNFIFFLGKTGMEIISKIMGLLLISLGIEFIVSGVESVLLK